MSRLPSRILLVCVCGMALACRHAPPSIPDQARLYASGGARESPRGQRQLEPMRARFDLALADSRHCASGG